MRSKRSQSTQSILSKRSKRMKSISYLIITIHITIVVIKCCWIFFYKYFSLFIRTLRAGACFTVSFALHKLFQKIILLTLANSRMGILVYVSYSCSAGIFNLFQHVMYMAYVSCLCGKECWLKTMDGRAYYRSVNIALQMCKLFLYIN